MKAYRAENKLQERVRALERVTGMKEITVYLVSNPTSTVAHPPASPVGGLSLAGGIRGRCREDARMGGLGAISDSRLTFTETLSYVMKNCLDLRPPYAKCGFQKKDLLHIWKPINQKSSRHFCTWDLFICEEYIILLNYGLRRDGIEQRKKHELGVRETWVWIMALPPASCGALAWWASVSLYTNGESSCMNDL